MLRTISQQVILEPIREMTAIDQLKGFSMTNQRVQSMLKLKRASQDKLTSIIEQKISNRGPASSIERASAGQDDGNATNEASLTDVNFLLS